MPNAPSRVEIITSYERQRRYSADQKLPSVEETIRSGMTVSAVVHRHEDSPSLLFGWTQRTAPDVKAAIQAGEDVMAASRVRESEYRIRDLKGLLGHKAMEDRDPAGGPQRRSANTAHLTVAVAAAGHFSVKVMADILSVVRSNLVQQVRGGPQPPYRYQRQGDDALLLAIRQPTDARPTYSYRRITALLNRARQTSEVEPLSYKRIYRLRLQGGLLLQRHGTRQLIRTHESIVIAPASKLSCSTDGLEIPCWNGEVVHLAFAIYTHNHEVMAWVAIAGGIGGEIVRDLMLGCVEQCHSVQRAPHPVRWLGDNGSAYAAYYTRNFDRRVEPRGLPYICPQS